MLLVTVPREVVPMPGAPGVTLTRPALGGLAGRMWSQATSHPRPTRQGLVRIALDANESEAGLLPGAVVGSRIASEADCARWRLHAATAHPQFGNYRQAHEDSFTAWRSRRATLGRALRREDVTPSMLSLAAERERLHALTAPWHASALAEKHDAIRGVVGSLDNTDTAKDILGAVGPALLALIIAGLWGPEWASLAVTVISSDGFSNFGTNAELNGGAMDAAGGGSTNVWFALGGNSMWNASAAGAQASCITSINGRALIDTTMADVADGNVDYVFRSGTQSGPTIRANATTCLGYVFIFNSGAWKIFKWSGTTNYTQIGSNSQASATTGDLANISASGTTIGATVNGGSAVSGTDATYATGRFGFHSVANVANVGDDYVGRDAAGGGGTVIPVVDEGMLTGGLQEMSGGL